MKSYSLSRRVLLIASTLVTVFLVLLALVLNSIFERSIEQAAQTALRTQVLLLLSDIELEQDASLYVPETLSEPRLSQIDSGLYAQISRMDESSQASLWKSESLLDVEIKTAVPKLGEFGFRLIGDPLEQSSAYQMSLLSEWEVESAVEGEVEGAGVNLLITVVENAEPYQAQIAAFQKQLFIYLFALGLALLVLQLLLLIWSFKPLRQVEQEINKVEVGELNRLEENYPQEVSRLSNSINQLLAHEERRLAQQKDTLGNLAHSLKTPLAVLKGLQFDGKDRSLGQEQIERIQGIIDYQLQQATTVGKSQWLKPIEIAQQAQQVVNSIIKVYADKDLSIQMDCHQSTVFVGDEGDFMEVFGNLLENAAKWSSKNIQIALHNINTNVKKNALQINVMDDGVGLSQNQKDLILQRGVRLDEYAPGHGLGLHIVKSIVVAYGGSIEVLEGGNDALSGAHFRIVI